MKNCFRLTTVLSLLLVSGNAFGHYKPSPTTPGKYTNWGGQIEKLEIVEPFKLADYQRIVVEPLDTSRVPLPKDGTKTYPPVKTVLEKTMSFEVQQIGADLADVLRSF